MSKKKSADDIKNVKWPSMQRANSYGITIFNVFILGGVSSDKRSKI